MNITLKRLLTLAFSAMVLAVLLVSVLSLIALRSTNQRFSNYVDDIAHREALVNQLLDGVKDTSINTYGLVLVSEPQDIDMGKQKIAASRQRTGKALSDFKKAIAASQDKSQADAGFADQIAEQLAAFEKSASDVMDLALAEKKAQAIVTMNQEVRPRLQDLFSTTQNYLEESGRHAAESVQAAKSLYGHSLILLISAGVLSVLCAVGLGWFITRSVLASLGSEPTVLGIAVSKVAAGDLREVAGAEQAPVGSVLSNIGKMQKQLHGLIGAIEQSTRSIVSATSEIAAGNMDLSGRTEMQASALEETAATMEELTAIVRNNSENAKKGMDLSTEASRVAQLGGDTVERVVETMTEINNSSRQVGQIISVIEGIAFQTNILALNAAVEAARAGEHGRGFAVVATEVRNLAHRSAAASREIKQLVDQSFNTVAKGSAMVTEAGSTMNEVVGAVRSVTALMSEIARAADEQRLGIEQINEAVSNMDSSTQQNAALVEEGAAAANSLQHQAQSLRKAVSVFNTGYLEIAA